MKRTADILAVFACLAALSLFSCRTTTMNESGFLNRSLIHAGKSYRFVVYVPPNRERAKKLPVLLFLHGAGERGDDGLRQTAVGVGSAIRWNPERFPMIVVFPQAPPQTQWLGDEAGFAMSALEQAAEEFGGDPTRFYLTGLSLGGYGTWHLALERPGIFAAIVPVCGGIRKPETSQNVRQSPLTIAAADPYAFVAEQVQRQRLAVWIFHGEADPLIPVSESRRMRDELTARGVEVRYTEYPRVGHNAWDPAYGTEELWTWLLGKRRG
ncbi:MAG TPA: prolyl oligopeptidase family serine peptidase [Thermoanaerobaculia bacterium]|nr:prolyl oligopeptidase family serine peptidase [Thermoanaerobaculia bacterium]